jgi:uncharacterized protein YndB with AHSA1/START domain
MLERRIEVAVAPARAFSVWTQSVALWWPPGHSMTGEDGARMAFEGTAGGQLVEIAPSGRRAIWGHVLDWDPPGRLAYSFLAGAPAGTATEVEVRFEPLDPGLTRVVVTHRPGTVPAEAWTHTVDRFAVGWAALIPAYTRHLEDRP